MKVADLKEQLENLDPEMEVHIGYDYGDHSHTTVTPAAVDAAECLVKRSEYHRMDAEFDSDDVAPEDTAEMIDSGEVKKVLVIR